MVEVGGGVMVAERRMDRGERAAMRLAKTSSLIQDVTHEQVTIELQGTEEALLDLCYSILV